MQAASISENNLGKVDERGLRSNQRLLKNFIFNKILAYYTSLAEQEGVSQRVLADRIGMDYGRLNKLLRAPSNLTLDTLSDLLTAMNATIDGFPIVKVIRETRSPTEFLSDFLVETREGDDSFATEDSADSLVSSSQVTPIRRYAERQTNNPKVNAKSVAQPDDKWCAYGNS